MKKILIADDSRTLREMLKYELEKNPEYKVFEASNGDEVLKIVDRIKPDLITMDIAMPGMNGYEVCSVLKSRGDDVSLIPVIFLTGEDTLEGRLRGHRVGGDDFIIKPFVPGELHSAVEKQLYSRDEISGATVLVVDDSSFIRKILEGYLAKEGIKVISVDRGDAALTMLHRMITRIDAIITDYNMPGLNGEELCRAIRIDIGDRDIPIVFVTSKKEVTEKLFNAGATDFLLKPFSKEELLSRIKVHLRVMMTKRLLYQNLIDVKRLSRELSQQNAEIELAKRKIEEKNKQIEEDLKMAGEFQQEFLRYSEIPEFVKFSSRYRPHTYVSGDFYFARTNENGDFNLMIGDVAGHGVAPALVSIMANTLIEKMNEESSLSNLMSHINNDIGRMIPEDRYLTATFLRISANGLLTVANGGHPGVIVLSPDSSELKVLKPEGIPLGMFEKAPEDFEEIDFQLKSGDKLILYTDGIIEQANKEGELFGLDKLEVLLIKNRKCDPESLLADVSMEFKKFFGRAEISDDITLLAVEFL